MKAHYLADLGGVICVTQVTYSDGTAIAHGNLGSPPGDPTYTLALAAGETLTGAFGTSVEILDSVGFWTSQGLNSGSWGNSLGGSPFSIPGHVVGFFGGTKGGNLAGLGVYTKQSSRVKHSRMFGTPTGDGFAPWDDGNGYQGLITASWGWTDCLTRFTFRFALLCIIWCITQGTSAST